MWTLKYNIVPRSVPGLPPSKNPVLISDGGCSLAYKEGSREHVLTIHYNCRQINFDFHATRWDADGIEPRDYFTVYLSAVKEIADLSENAVSAIRADIRDGLTHWPPTAVAQQLPIRDVIFV